MSLRTFCGYLLLLTGMVSGVLALSMFLATSYAHVDLFVLGCVLAWLALCTAGAGFTFLNDADRGRP